MAKAKSSKQEAHLRGEVVVRPLESVRPNGWNPNKVPAHVMRSIEHGFRADGWIASNALLVWGTDETGARRDLIIDGEHKWKAAKAVGLKDGPMVVLDGVTEREARALTVKMNQKRGEWDEDGLGALLKSIREESEPEMALVLGFAEDELTGLLGAAEDRSSAAPPSPQRATLAERFGVPPFSILNAREGWWQARKAAWLALGIKSELGRGNGNVEMAHPATTDQAANASRRANAAPGGSKQPLDRPEHVEKFKRSRVSPGGSPRPSAKTVGGRAVRGDGRCRPLPEAKV